MRELKKEFDGRGQVKGFRFTQIEQNHKAFIYQVDNNGTKHYEVFKRVENTRYNCVSYPTYKAFGIWAWSYFDFNNAIAKFQELTEVDNG